MNRTFCKVALKASRTLRLDRKMPDDLYLKLMYKVQMGRELNLDEPRTFNEKLNWLKLHDRNPLYTTLVDKYRMKQWVADRIGEQYVIPTLAVWDSADDIDLAELPDRFVLKTNHDSGGVVICHDKASFDLEAARAKLRESLGRNYFWQCREWPYKDVKPLIFAEEYLDSDDGVDLADYKFMCFAGEPDCVMLCAERQSGDPKFLFFDRDWNLKRYNVRSTRLPDGYSCEPPKGLGDMFDVASRLSSGFPFVRVDLYGVAGRVFCGEMTFYPQAGWDQNILEDADLRWGSMIPSS